MKNIAVIKCGGSTLEQLSDDFFAGVAQLKAHGLHPVIVHGGGPAIKQMLDKLEVTTEFVNGLRKTSKEAMDVVEMVLAGKVNKTLVQNLQNHGLEAVGVSGVDHHLLIAKAKDEEALGYVGDVTEVKTDFITALINLDVVPVIAPVAVNENGDHLNVNADTAAGAVARALEAEKLIFVTDVPGILKDGERLEEVTDQDVRLFIENGTIYGGMIPKVEAALASLKGQLKQVMIVDGTSKIIDDQALVGTTIKLGLEVS